MKLVCACPLDTCWTPQVERDVVTKRMDFYGPAVNRAARVEGQADGGQFLICETTYRHTVSETTYRHTASETTYRLGQEVWNCAVPGEQIQSGVSVVSVSLISFLGLHLLNGRQHPHHPLPHLTSLDHPSFPRPPLLSSRAPRAYARATAVGVER